MNHEWRIEDFHGGGGPNPYLRCNAGLDRLSNRHVVGADQ